MASGKTHARITAGLATASIALWPYLPMGQLVTAGILVGLVVEPDLDQPGRTYSESLIRRLPGIGWPVSYLWQTMWTPYSMIRHRSPVSHWPILSDVIRWLYMLVVINLLLVAFREDPLTVANWPAGLELVFVGNCVATAGHWFADVVSSEWKRQARKYK